MKTIICATAAMLVLAGCATSKSVALAQTSNIRPIKTAALTKEDGSSPAMDASFNEAIRAQGVTLGGSLPAGTRTATNVDAIVSYIDVWHWDLVMYLKAVDVHMFDAQSGNLLVSGWWANSAFHGFQDSKEVVRGLVADMFANVKPAQAAVAVAAP